MLRNPSYEYGGCGGVNENGHADWRNGGIMQGGGEKRRENVFNVKNYDLINGCDV